jgi:NADPH:quinone reductase-like Zn-dependent oxidoreductase
MPDPMDAMVITEFGGPEVFDEREVPKPEPRPTELLVEVHATSVNPVDLKIREAGEWAGVEPPAIIGYDVSGRIVSIGDDVNDFTPGDKVYYTPEIFEGGSGSYAQYHTVDESIVARKPEPLSHSEAATLPLAGGTAWEALVTHADVSPGERVLVHGGAGGVGSIGIQLAAGAGAEVFTTCASYDADMVRELGADHVIDYETDDLVDEVHEATSGYGVDIALDTVGDQVLEETIGAMTDHGRIVSLVSADCDLSDAHPRNVDVTFMFLERGRAKLDAMRRMVEAQRIDPVVADTVDLADVAKAHERLAEGGVGGKIAVDVPTP